VIAATNKDLDAMVGDGAFREDLYYRLSVIPMIVPPLRERTEDVPLLAHHFLKKYAGPAGRSIVRIASESIEALCQYPWPGNVRQLENTIERAVALSTGNEVTVELPTEKPKAFAAIAAAGFDSAVAAPFSGSQFPLPPDGFDMERYVADLEKSILKTALQKSNDVQTRAAGMLSLSYRSFRHLMKKYDL